MTNLFFKDARGNFWSVNKVIGFVRDVVPTEESNAFPSTENKEEVYYLAILEGGMSTELTKVLYEELTKSLIVLESAEPEEA